MPCFNAAFKISGFVFLWHWHPQLSLVAVFPIPTFFFYQCMARGTPPGDVCAWAGEGGQAGR